MGDCASREGTALSERYDLVLHIKGNQLKVKLGIVVASKHGDVVSARSHRSSLSTAMNNFQIVSQAERGERVDTAAELQSDQADSCQGQGFKVHFLLS